MKKCAEADDEIKARANAAPEDELEIVENFLSKFCFEPSASSKKEQIDLKLALKAMPTRLDSSNYLRATYFNFKDTYVSLIAFNNQNQDQLFNYYDLRNKTRLRKLKEKATIT